MRRACRTGLCRHRPIAMHIAAQQLVAQARKFARGARLYRHAVAAVGRQCEFAGACSHPPVLVGLPFASQRPAGSPPKALPLGSRLRTGAGVVRGSSESVLQERSARTI